MAGWALTIAAGLALVTIPAAWGQSAAGDPAVYGLLHQAELSAGRGEWPAAVESCRQALASNGATPTDRMRALLLMGDALRAQGSFAQAETAYQGAFELAQAPPAPHEPHRLAALEGLSAAQAQVAGDPSAARLAGIRERLAHPAVALYVAPGGDDTAAGDQAHPLATPEDAQRRVRALRAAGDLLPGGVTVYLRAGAYHRSTPLDLTAEDSGTAQAPVVYRSFPGESARLIGGRRVGGFEPVTDPAILARLPEEARGQVLRTDLRAQGVVDFGVFRNAGYGIRGEPPAGLELFCDGRPMQLARWPNEGWVHIGALTDEEHPIYRGVPSDRTGKFIYEGDRPLRWTDETDLWLLGYWANPYAAGFAKVTSMDTDTRLIQTAEPYPPSGMCKGWPYFVLNALAEVDMPGEWHLDRDSGILYFWPPTPLAQAEVVVSELSEPLVRMTDASHVALVGLILEATRGHGVEITGGEGNLVAACTIRNTGRWAAAIAGGSNNGLLGCDLMDTGDGGVILSGGDRKTLTPCGNFVENCHIQRFGRWVRTHRVACQVRGVGIRLSHNVIHDGPTMAIM
ncbi:MAG TPA: right-handed parallel beta-helix repeat-containing protein, partial [Armatimonadota bacterium]|nr:right-handed parallel beta-helix repeat-containing protein [Armatimonadota bacterium]